jgi:hypothetical protein
MNVNDYLNAVKLTEQLALENYEQRNGVVDYRLPGVCNHHLATYDRNGKRNCELCLSCTVSKNIKGQLRYTFKINDERIAYKNLYYKFHKLGAFNDQLYAPALVWFSPGGVWVSLQMTPLYVLTLRDSPSLLLAAGQVVGECYEHVA